jgi:ABC-type branched-subunit amino acid transport system substrate-binding protein
MEGAPATGAPQRLGGSGGGGARKVAVLVPQSGRGRDLGKPLMDAAQMALFDSGRSDITMIVKDTGAGAGSAAQAAINEGAGIIIGPVFADEVSAVRAAAAPAGVPVLTFSSDGSVGGGGVYTMSFPLEEEVRAIVNYAASQNLTRYAIMAPGDAYGSRASMAFEKDVTGIGGQIVANVTFGGAKEALYPYVLQLEGKQFDAVFVPAGGSSLRAIAEMLRFGPPAPGAPTPLTDEQKAAGVAPPPPVAPSRRAQLPAEFTLLGTGLWDEGTNGSSSGLNRGVFAAPEPGTRENFGMRFEGVYGYRPPRVASLGYDAMTLATAVAGGMPGQGISQNSITNPNGFDGVDGIFRFLPNGRIQRGLAIIQATGGGFQVIKPAPYTFQTPGS